MQDGRRGVEWLEKNHAETLTGKGEYGDQHWAEIRAEVLVDVCRELKENPEVSYDFLLDVSAVHWPDRPHTMELVYHLYSLEYNDRLRLKVLCADEGPVPSLSALWRSAVWNERETYDMFGIRFDGHPDLRRILMPEDYTDFPLRKEFPLYTG